MTPAIEILFRSSEERPWFVVNKPAGISVHNDPGRDLVSLLAAQEGLTSLLPVNRLDLETSGIILLASDGDRVAELNAALACSKKYYLAICRGTRPADSNGDWQEWNWSLSKKAEGFRNPQGKSPERVKSLTRWKVLASSTDRTLLLVHLLTGRKHQIRRHAALAKSPIWNENRYIKNSTKISYFGLHSFALMFSIGEKEFSFRCLPGNEFSELTEPLEVSLEEIGVI